MRRPTPMSVDRGRYRQLTRQMEAGRYRRRLIWVALQNHRFLRARIRAARREGLTWPDDSAHPVVTEATDWRVLANYGRWLERQPTQGELFGRVA